MPGAGCIDYDADMRSSIFDALSEKIEIGQADSVIMMPHGEPMPAHYPLICADGSLTYRPTYPATILCDTRSAGTGQLIYRENAVGCARVEIMTTVDAKYLDGMLHGHSVVTIERFVDQKIRWFHRTSSVWYHGALVRSSQSSGNIE